MNGPTLQAPPMTNMNFNPYVNPVNYGPSGSFGNIGALVSIYYYCKVSFIQI